MSTSIEIKMVNTGDGGVCPIEVIQRLMDYGWTLNDNDKTSYLPLGDEDDFDWQRETIDEKLLMSILRQKKQNKETIGIVLTWDGTNIGGEFLLRTDSSVSVNLNINRKQMEDDNLGITDINWYLVKLLPVFKQGNLQVESFCYEEYI
ncbi:MAG: hypothetical protein N3B21_00370 [Clostridia bacterium]|nr:hypothetical protein [Clostridia bacterium]